MAKSGVSLVAPRPLGIRETNEYIETPLPKVHRSHHHQHHQDDVGGLVGGGRNKKTNKEVVSSVTRSQPTKGGGGGGPSPLLAGSGPQQPLNSSSSSIICPACGRCRCESCRRPPEPPSAWLCSDLCYVSPDSCVDYVTCLCCVKALAYHCGGDDSELSNDPCSCSSNSWLRRWSCLGLASLFLPCLCCYCPLKALSDSCTSAYAACSHRGCSCHPS